MKIGDAVRFEFQVEFGAPATRRRTGAGVVVSESEACGFGWVVRVESSPNYRAGEFVTVRRHNLSRAPAGEG